MSEITVQGLLTDAGIIRGEIHDSQNSHDRVGKMFEDIIKYIQAHEDSWATGGGGEGDGTSSITGTLLLNGLNGKDNPSLDDQILHWSSNTGWGYITTPTGGSGTGGGVTWQQLDTNTSEQINASHLSNALSNYVAKVNMAGTNAVYEWWGNKFPATPSNGVYKINGAIEFSNGVRIAPEEGNHTLKIEAWDNSSNPAHIYATGGVSALGNSSSGGSGGGGEGEGTPLNNLLGHINSNDYYGTTSTVSPSTGDTIIYNGTKWKVGSIDLEDLLGTAPAQFVASKILAKDSGDNYKWIDASGIGGSTSITNLWKVGDVGTDSGYTNTPIVDGHILQYGNSKWNNVAFGINAGTANSILSSITLGGNTYSLPQANGNAMGIVKAGDGLSASSGTMSLTAATTSTLGGIRIGYTQNGKNYPVALSDNKAYVNVPWENTVYSHPTYTAQSSLKLYRITVDNLGHVASTAVADKYDIANVLEGHTSVEISITGSAAKLNESIGSRSIWGQTYWNEGLPQNVQGDLIVEKDTTTNNESIKLSPNTLNVENPKIYMLGRNILEYERSKNNVSVDTLAIGFGAEGNNLTHTNIIGKNIELTSTVGNVYIPNASTLAKGLRIGDAVLYWDSQNNSLAVKKYDDSACNFYAFGGVSALGMSSGIGTIPTMTFGNLTITDSIDVANKIIFDSDYEDDVYIKSMESQLHLSSLDYIYLDTPVYSISIGDGSTISGIRVGTGNKLVFTIDGNEYNVSYTQ